MTDQEQEFHERGYTEGQRAAWVEILGMALRSLGYEGPEAERHRWIGEREAAIAQLRMACAEFGDNEWDESLHLADIIEKHLVQHLERSND